MAFVTKVSRRDIWRWGLPFVWVEEAFRVFAEMCTKNDGSK